MKADHGIALDDMERLTRSTLTELSSTSPQLDRFVQTVIQNSLEVLGVPPWEGVEIYVAEGECPNSTFLRTTEPENVIGTYEFDADDLKRLHNASISHRKVEIARHAMVSAKKAHNELVALNKKHPTFKSFTRRTNAINEASHCYGVNTLKKLSKEVKVRMADTW